MNMIIINITCEPFVIHLNEMTYPNRRFDKSDPRIPVLSPELLFTFELNRPSVYSMVASNDSNRWSGYHASKSTSANPF